MKIACYECPRNCLLSFKKFHDDIFFKKPSKCPWYGTTRTWKLLPDYTEEWVPIDKILKKFSVSDKKLRQVTLDKEYSLPDWVTEEQYGFDKVTSRYFQVIKILNKSTAMIQFISDNDVEYIGSRAFEYCIKAERIVSFKPADE
jgi:hypothetical protein